MADYPDRPFYVKGECVCVYCGFDGRLSVLAWHQLVIEHVIPLQCKQAERKNSPRNIDVNKRVACQKCNEVKKGWDKKYNDGTPHAPTPKEVERALKSASEYIRERYAIMDADFEPMMKEIAEIISTGC
jgi:5-methylcytosine-specific restriction endonuclease McrA